MCIYAYLFQNYLIFVAYILDIFACDGDFFKYQASLN